MTVEDRAPGSAPVAAPIRAPGTLARDAFGWAQVRYVLTVYLTVRAGLLVVGLLAVGLLPRNGQLDERVAAREPELSGWQTALTAYDRWDLGWFLRIAAEGYSPDNPSAAFFPLYPLMIRGVAALPGIDVFMAAHLVSNTALVGALLLLHRLTAAEFGEQRARLTVLLVCVFPTGFFLFAPYTESLFLLLAVGCLYSARRGAWAAAALCGAAASGTRSVGVLLVLPLLAEAVQQVRAHPDRRARLRAVVLPFASVLVVPLGLVGYLLHWRQRTGDALRPFDTQGGFGRERAWPWETLWDGLRVAVQFMGSFPGGYQGLDAVMVLLALVLATWVAVRTRPLYGVYAWSSLVLPLLLPFAGRPFMSVPRFLVVIFPLIWALVAFAERFSARDAVVAVSAGGLGMCSMLFVGNYFLF